MLLQTQNCIVEWCYHCNNQIHTSQGGTLLGCLFIHLLLGLRWKPSHTSLSGIPWPGQPNCAHVGVLNLNLKVRQNPTSVFLASLATADLLLLTVCLPLKMAKLFTFSWQVVKLASNMDTNCILCLSELI